MVAAVAASTAVAAADTDTAKRGSTQRAEDDPSALSFGLYLMAITRYSL
jgi:hypothetical protein